MFNIDEFISKRVTERKESLFKRDLEENFEKIKKVFTGSKVIILGGAGSIGTAFIKEVLTFEIDCLVVVDINENALTELTRDLRSSHISLPLEYRTYPMDLSMKSVGKIFKKYNGFDVVANFAAHKHVRSEKDTYSIEALLENNILKAMKLMELLKEYPPKRFFYVSTDKAANPTNVMGASKRIMEDVIMYYSKFYKVSLARFANVAFSNGSLLYGFEERIKKQQPLSAPTDIKRYFVAPKEAGEICLLACIGEENREIFYPKLGLKTTKSFDEIGRALLIEIGYEPLYCSSESEAIEKIPEIARGLYPVFFSKADTSGEKEVEEFFTDEEEVDEERFHAIGVIFGKEVEQDKILAFKSQLEQLIEDEESQKEDYIRLLGDYLKNFSHIEKNKILDDKM